MSALENLRKKLRKLGSPQKAKVYGVFFKTGPGQYGEGDQFLGVTVPEQRQVARAFKDLPLADLKKLLHSKIHEERLTALLILVSQYQSADEAGKKKIYSFYLANAKRVNNWDLVDSSAHHIVGHFLSNKNSAVLDQLSRSKNLWERRISIVATWHGIRNGNVKDVIRISGKLLNDDHDLIHKAVGWMLREAGKRNPSALENFLAKHHHKMPRTMLRYSIEKFPEKKRKQYLNGKR